MGLDNILKNAGEAILKPTQEEINYWNQTLEGVFRGTSEMGKKIFEEVLRGYSAEEREKIKSALSFAWGAGYFPLLAMYSLAKNIGEMTMDYRMQREFMDIATRILGTIASNINPYIGEMISRRPREMEAVVNSIVTGMISYLKNNGVKDPEKAVSAYMMYAGLFGNAIIALYEKLREIYTPKGIKLKLPGLIGPLYEFAKYFAYDNIEEVIKGLGSEKPKEEQGGKEENKEESKSKDKKGNKKGKENKGSGS